jgi:DNA-binding NarL/FixJ family response regulator
MRDCWVELKEVKKEISALLKRQEELIALCHEQLYNLVPQAKVLSSRERQILRLFIVNPEFGNKQVAWELNISERTVKFHVSAILSKYGVHKRADLMRVIIKEMI